MKHIMTAIGFTAMLATAPACIAQPQSPAVIAKHQLSECMSRRMAASKTVSYNEAMRACKDRLQPPKETLAANDPADTASKSR